MPPQSRQPSTDLMLVVREASFVSRDEVISSERSAISAFNCISSLTEGQNVSRLALHTSREEKPASRAPHFLDTPIDTLIFWAVRSCLLRANILLHSGCQRIDGVGDVAWPLRCIMEFIISNELAACRNCGTSICSSATPCR